MTVFQDATPTPEGDWRHIVRFGRNIASYKFALGRVLLEHGVRQQTFVSLTELAVPYTAALCEHLQVENKQTTSAQCRFLDACTSLNRRGEPEQSKLRETLIKQLGSTSGERLRTLVCRHNAATALLRPWHPPLCLAW